MQLLCLLSSLLLLGHSCASLALNTYALYLRRLAECAARANRPSLACQDYSVSFSSHHEVRLQVVWRVNPLRELQSPWWCHGAL